MNMTISFGILPEDITRFALGDKVIMHQDEAGNRCFTMTVDPRDVHITNSKTQYPEIQLSGFLLRRKKN